MTPNNSHLRAEASEAVRDLLKALEDSCPGEKGHAERVSVYAVATAERLGWTGDRLVSVRIAAELHDVGKLQADGLLYQNGPRSPEDWARCRRHPEDGADQIARELHWEDIARAVRHHHERWDGSGYPSGFAGEAIPEISRIIGVAEAFDAMVFATWRSNRLSERQALKELDRELGKQFDPQVLKAFTQVQPLIQPVI